MPTSGTAFFYSGKNPNTNKMNFNLSSSSSSSNNGGGSSSNGNNNNNNERGKIMIKGNDGTLISSGVTKISRPNEDIFSMSSINNNNNFIKPDNKYNNSGDNRDYDIKNNMSMGYYNHRDSDSDDDAMLNDENDENEVYFFTYRHYHLFNYLSFQLSSLSIHLSSS
jgi:hypothetical protein